MSYPIPEMTSRYLQAMWFAIYDYLCSMINTTKLNIDSSYQQNK